MTFPSFKLICACTCTAIHPHQFVASMNCPPILPKSSSLKLISAHMQLSIHAPSSSLSLTVCSLNGHDAASLWPITCGPTTSKTTRSLCCSHFYVLLHPILGILYLLQLATAQRHHPPTKWPTDCCGGVGEATHRVTTMLCTV